MGMPHAKGKSDQEDAKGKSDYNDAKSEPEPDDAEEEDYVPDPDLLSPDTRGERPEIILMRALSSELEGLSRAGFAQCANWEDARDLGLTGLWGRTEGQDGFFTAEIQKRSRCTKWDRACVLLKRTSFGSLEVHHELSVQLPAAEERHFPRVARNCRGLVAVAKVLSENELAAGAARIDNGNLKFLLPIVRQWAD